MNRKFHGKIDNNFKITYLLTYINTELYKIGWRVEVFHFADFKKNRL